MISLALCIVLMIGDSMLLTSYYAFSLVVIWGLLAMKPHFLKINVSELSLELSLNSDYGLSKDVFGYLELKFSSF